MRGLALSPPRFSKYCEIAIPPEFSEKKNGGRSWSGAPTCGCDLQGKRARRPKTGRRAQRCTTFMASTKIVQKGQSKRSTTKSSSRLRPPPHTFLKIHRTSPSNGQTRRSCPLLVDALVRVREGTQSRAKADEATMHQKHCFHQRRRNPSP